MKSETKLREIDIGNRPYFFFDDLIDINNINPKKQI